MKIQTSQQMPSPFLCVFVEGGEALWTGSVWLSKNKSGDFDRVITWPVIWWSLSISEDDES